MPRRKDESKPLPGSSGTAFDVQFDDRPRGTVIQVHRLGRFVGSARIDDEDGICELLTRMRLAAEGRGRWKGGRWEESAE